MSSTDILRLEGLSAGYKKVPIIHDVALSMAAGDTVAVVGANGAGKTTLLRVIMGEIAAARGRVLFDGGSLARLPTYQRARLGIGYAPEGRHLFPAMSVEENLELGATRISANARAKRIQTLLEVFPKLSPLRRRHCGLLSGGEQQMVAIARALMPEPRLLLLDEPSTGLAPKVVGEMYQSLSTLLQTGLTILVAEQNARAALKFAKRAVVFEDGRIVAAGKAADLMTDPRVVEAYLGGTHAPPASAPSRGSAAIGL